MDEFWVRALVAVLAASCGVATVVVVLVGRYCRRGGKPLAAGLAVSEGSRSPSERPGSRPPGAGSFGSSTPPSGGTSSVDRCEQAALRAERAVDSVSSAPVRERLSPVVRRMEAELPNVQALAELARGLDAGSAHAGPVADRTREQLDNAASRFAGIADEVVRTVDHLADESDLDRVRDRVASLRARFPLTCSMSDVLGASVAA